MDVIKFATQQYIFFRELGFTCEESFFQAQMTTSQFVIERSAKNGTAPSMEVLNDFFYVCNNAQFCSLAETSFAENKLYTKLSIVQ